MNSKDDINPESLADTTISERGSTKRIIPKGVAGEKERIRKNISEEQILADVKEMEAILGETVPKEITTESSEEEVGDYLLSLEPLEPSDVPVHEETITQPSGIRRREPEPEPPTPADIAAEICKMEGITREGIDQTFRVYPRKPGDLRRAEPLRELTETEKEKYK